MTMSIAQFAAAYGPYAFAPIAMVLLYRMVWRPEADRTRAFRTTELEAETAIAQAQADTALALKDSSGNMKDISANLTTGLAGVRTLTDALNQSVRANQTQIETMTSLATRVEVALARQRNEEGGSWPAGSRKATG
jgi:hypothetical protein